MTKPTDPEINAALARALGWTDVEDYVHNPNVGGEYELVTVWFPPGCPDTEDWDNSKMLPPFCSDRNRLPEILAAVEKAGKRTAFMAELYQDGRVWPNLWEVLTLPPRAYAVAALKALGGWPEGWGEEE